MNIWKAFTVITISAIGVCVGTGICMHRSVQEATRIREANAKVRNELCSNFCAGERWSWTYHRYKGYRCFCNDGKIAELP